MCLKYKTEIALIKIIDNTQDKIKKTIDFNCTDKECMFFRSYNIFLFTKNMTTCCSKCVKYKNIKDEILKYENYRYQIEVENYNLNLIHNNLHEDILLQLHRYVPNWFEI